jgi:hypothetical protein
MTDTVQARMAEAQRIIDAGYPDIDGYNMPETVSIVLKVSSQLYLPYKAYNYIEQYYMNRKAA